MSGTPELKDDRFPTVARDLPGGRGTPVVRTGNADRRLDAPSPDEPAHDFTGRYLGADDPGYLGGHPHLRLLVNQAGTHVQALIVFHATGDVVHLMGDLAPEGDCPLFYFEQPARTAALLERDGDDALLTLTDVDEPGTHRLRRYDRRPSYFQHAFDGVPRDRAELVRRARALELWPLYVPLRERRLAALKEKLDEELTTFFEISGIDMGAGLARNKQLKRINAAVGRAFEGLVPNDVVQLEHAARAWAGSEVTASFGGGESYRYWLAQAIQQTRRDGAFDPTYGAEREPSIGHLVRGLGVRPGNAKAKFKATLTLAGVASPSRGWFPSIKGYLATLELHQVGESPWSATYTLMFAGVGWGFSTDKAGKTSLEGERNEGTGESEYAWLPHEVEGWCTLAGAAASATAHVGASKGVSALMIQGADTQTRPLVIDMSDLDLTALEVTKVKPGVEAQVEASVLVGWVVSHDETKKRRRPPEEVFRTESAALDLQQQARVHFESLGSAVLSPDGRQLLRMLAALELPAFMSPDSKLAINGHTDRVDTFDRNLWLAYFRVQNVRRALIDILGEKLRVSSSGAPEAERLTAVDVEGEDREWVGRLRVGNLALTWLGELLALREGEPDRKENVQFRRVDVILNHQLVVSLKAPRSRAPDEAE